MVILIRGLSFLAVACCSFCPGVNADPPAEIRFSSKSIGNGLFSVTWPTPQAPNFASLKVENPQLSAGTDYLAYPIVDFTGEKRFIQGFILAGKTSFLLHFTAPMKSYRLSIRDDEILIERIKLRREQDR